MVPKVIVKYGSMAKLLKTVDAYDRLSLRSVDLHMAFNGQTKKVGRVRTNRPF